MAASRSMLESLLARVRQRAAEPRYQVPPMPPLQAPQIERPAASPAPVPPPVAPPAAAAAVEETEEELIEEYDEELIELVDDADVASEVAAESSAESVPIELRASAPTVEMRRRVAPPSLGPSGTATARPAAAPPAPAFATPLRPEVVAARPAAAGAVVQSHGVRPEARTASFLELLDASLKLGS